MIAESIDRHGESLGEDDCLIVYFAGHGKVIDLPSSGRAGYLLPYDAELDLHDTSDPARWAEEAIDVRELAARTSKLRTKHVLLVADACASGFMTSRGDIKARLDLQTILTKPSRAVITATTENQAAGEDLNKKHGYFTAALLDRLERLSASSEAASVTDLFAEVRNVVTRETNKAMTPQMSNVGEGEFVFLPKSIPAEIIKAAIDDEAMAAPSTLSGIVDRNVKRTARMTTFKDVLDAYQAYDYHFSSEPAKGEMHWRSRRQRFEENASLTDPLAMAGMHFVEARGFGQAADPAKAYSWAVKAYQTGDPAGMHVLGRCYLDGIGVEKNKSAGQELTRAAAEAGFPMGKFALAQETLSKLEATKRGESVSLGAGELERARAHLKFAADSGVNEAVRTLASLLLVGEGGFEMDASGAVRLLKDSSKGGPSAASRLLVQLLWSGVPGVLDADPDAAIAEVRKAAAAGDAWAQYRLAFVLRSGQGVPADDAEAFRWADLAFRQGQPGAEVLLSEMYFEGKGVGKDVDRGIKCLERGKEAGSKAASIALGSLYFDGTYRPADLNLALSNFLQAAQLGLADGWYRAGLCYEAKYEEWVRELRNDVVLKGKEGQTDLFSTLDKLDLEMPHNPLAQQATLCFMKASRMGHERAQTSLLPRNKFGHPELIKWAEVALDPEGPGFASGFDDIPEWIRNADLEVKKRKDARSMEIRKRLIDEAKKSP